ncbi:MAG: aminotransferase class V-fold PLP-dependent enzyme [Chloroflexi bacterium]|nr:aminotransferase class V-fold PLP-dependent enzyme [Chloroflexota bacterium]
MDEKLHAIREQLPATLDQVYLNTGTCGPLPLPSLVAMQEALDGDVRLGRITTESYQRHSALREGTRSQLARLVGATEREIALTHNTGEGLNIVLSGMDWNQDDEVITTDAEHVSLLAPLANLRQHRGVRIVEVDGGAPERVPELVQKAITSRTKLVALSHVSYATGALYPLEPIVAAAHQADLPVLIDGAQSAGAIPLALDDLGIDYYAIPGQKWLCGPEGTGALYIRDGMWNALNNSWVGYYSQDFSHSEREFVPYDAARRFEVGSQNAADFAGLNESLRWLSNDVGFSWIYERNHALAALAIAELSGVRSVSVVTPQKHAGLVAFALRSGGPKALVTLLAERGIIVRSIPGAPFCRMSTGFFNTEEEIRRTAAAIAELTA